MIPDLYKDIKIQLYERATSPLLGSFVISWCLWNYKLFLVLFSSGTAFEKIARIEIARIEYVLYPNFWWDGALVGLFYPLTTTAFFIIVFPYPARFVFWMTRYQQMKTKEVQQKIEDETPLTQEEAREIRSNLRSIAQRHDEEITEKDKEIADYNTAVEQLNIKLSNAEIKNEETGAELRTANAELSRRQSQNEKSVRSELEDTSDTESKSNDSRDWKEILGDLVNLKGERREISTTLMRDFLLDLNTSNRSRDHIDEKFNNHKDLQEYILNSLEKNNFIRYLNSKYRLTDYGNEFVVERLLDAN